MLIILVLLFCYISRIFVTRVANYLRFFISFIYCNFIVKNDCIIIKGNNRKSGGGSLDKIFGAFFGILRGGLIVVALSLLGTMTALTEEDAWVNAKTRVYLEFSVIQIIPYLPESVVDKIKIDIEGWRN